MSDWVLDLALIKEKGVAATLCDGKVAYCKEVGSFSVLLAPLKGILIFNRSLLIRKRNHYSIFLRCTSHRVFQRLECYSREVFQEKIIETIENCHLHPLCFCYNLSCLSYHLQFILVFQPCIVFLLFVLMLHDHHLLHFYSAFSPSQICI